MFDPKSRLNSANRKRIIKTPTSGTKTTPNRPFQHSVPTSRLIDGIFLLSFRLKPFSHRTIAEWVLITFGRIPEFGFMCVPSRTFGTIERQWKEQWSIEKAPSISKMKKDHHCIHVARPKICSWYASKIPLASAGATAILQLDTERLHVPNKRSRFRRSSPCAPRCL